MGPIRQTLLGQRPFCQGLEFSVGARVGDHGVQQGGFQQHGVVVDTGIEQQLDEVCGLLLAGPVRTLQRALPSLFKERVGEVGAATAAQVDLVEPLPDLLDGLVGQRADVEHGQRARLHLHLVRPQLQVQRMPARTAGDTAADDQIGPQALARSFEPLRHRCVRAQRAQGSQAAIKRHDADAGPAGQAVDDHGHQPQLDPGHQPIVGVVVQRQDQQRQARRLRLGQRRHASGAQVVAFGRVELHRGFETVADTVGGADHRRRLAEVADGLAQLHHGARQRAFAARLAVPAGGQQVGLAHHAVALVDQLRQHLQRPRTHRLGAAGAPQFVAAAVEHAIGKSGALPVHRGRLKAQRAASARDRA